MGVEINGVDDLADKLERKAEAALGIQGDNEVSAEELFTPAFMQSHTEVDSFEEFLEASQWDVESQADFAAIPDSQFDKYVNEKTSFPDWDAMLGEAGQEWAARQLR
jgi:hypothetical protein